MGNLGGLTCQRVGIGVKRAAMHADAHAHTRPALAAIAFVHFGADFTGGAGVLELGHDLIADFGQHTTVVLFGPGCEGLQAVGDQGLSLHIADLLISPQPAPGSQWSALPHNSVRRWSRPQL